MVHNKNDLETFSKNSNKLLKQYSNNPMLRQRDLCNKEVNPRHENRVEEKQNGMA